MKKLLLVPILFLSSCTLPWATVEHNFENDYSRHIASVFDRINDGIDAYYGLLEDFYPSGYDNSTIRFSGMVPKVGSWEITIKADAIRQTLKQAFSAEFDINGFLETTDQLFRLEKLTGGIMYQIGSYYFRLDTATISGSGDSFIGIQKNWDETIQKMQPYLGKWVTLNTVEMVKINPDIASTDNLMARIVIAIEMDILSGWKKLQKILTEHSPIRSIAELGKDGNMYRYQVELDKTWSLALLDAIVLEYSGTGISPEERVKYMEILSEITLSGVLALDEDTTGYYSFLWQLTGSGWWGAFDIDMAYIEDEAHLVFMEKEKEAFSFRSKADWDKSHTTFSASGKTLMTMDRVKNGKNAESGDISITPSEGSGTHVVYSLDMKKDFSLKVEEINSDIVWIDINGKINQNKLQNIIWSFRVEKDNTVNFSYSLDEDGKLSGKIDGTKFPMWVTLDGRYKKDDIAINIAVGGMTITLNHKKEKDNTFDGSIRFPVGTLTWKGKATQEFYDTLLVTLVSPVASASLDMKTVDGWLMGPLQVRSSQAPIDIPSIDIRAKRKGKDFSLQTDIGMGSGVTEKAHFEWDSHIDIRYDKKAEIKIPTEFIPFSQAFSGFLAEPKHSFEWIDSAEQDFNNI